MELALGKTPFGGVPYQVMVAAKLHANEDTLDLTAEDRTFSAVCSGLDWVLAGAQLGSATLAGAIGQGWVPRIIPVQNFYNEYKPCIMCSASCSKVVV